MKRGTAKILSVISCLVIIILSFILIFAENEAAMCIVLIVYVPIALVLNYFQRCPSCGAWPRKGSFFHEYCPRCGAYLSDE